jgi:MFS family permease
VWLGGIVFSIAAGFLANYFGRRRILILSAYFTLFAVILQTASQNVVIFCFSRAFIGFGATLSMIAGTTYVAETLPANRRGWGVGLLGDLFYIGKISQRSMNLNSAYCVL